MAGLFHPSRVGPLPSVAEVKTGRTVYGRTAAGFAHNIGALLGARFRRVFSTSIELDDVENDNSDSVNLETDYNIRWRLSPEADGIYVGIWCVAQSNQTTPPSVTAALYSESGVLIDAGVEWSEANGLLPVSPMQRSVAFSPIYGATCGGDQYIETGWVREAAAGGGGGVRLIAGGDPGDVVEMRFIFTGTRPYSITIAEVVTGHLVEP